jgi:hypothetical protein
MFIAPDCPLSQSYAYTFRQLLDSFSQNFDGYLVLSGNDYSISEQALFEDSFSFGTPLILDENYQLAQFLGATVTPEVFMLDSTKQVLYSGKIDNWAIGLARKKIRADSFYLRWAMQDFLNNKPITIKRTEPVGCVLEYPIN